MKYLISDLEQFSGIQSHTIRIWEQRYHALQPKRSAGNTRYYDDNQLRRLLNIVSLTQSGLKISKVCALSDQELENFLQQQLAQHNADDAGHEYYIFRLINAGIAYDEPTFDNLFSKCIIAYGMVESYKNIIYPMLIRLGLMWGKDDICPAQEHFLSNLIRQKLFAAINDLPVYESQEPVWMLFLPEDEEHDIGLLFAKYLLRTVGQKVIYLGSRVPLASIKEVMEQNAIHHILLFMTRLRPVAEAQTYLDKLRDVYPDVQIHLSGNVKLIGNLHLKPEITWFKEITDFENYLPDKTQQI